MNEHKATEIAYKNGYKQGMIDGVQIFTEQSRTDLKAIVEHYGINAQLTMCLEEMSELSKEICKYQRGVLHLNAIMEEVADVLITIEQVRLIFCITDYEIQNIIENKIHRTLMRIKQNNHECTECKQFVGCESYGRTCERFEHK